MTPNHIKHTTSVCSHCLNKVPATVYELAGEVFLDKTCPKHGEEKALLASDAAFYYKAHAEGTIAGIGSCGPGGCMSNHSCTMMFEITERCNLTCPTCFTASSPEVKWMMSLDDFEAKLDRLLAAGKGDSDIVQISGGEPTVHPDWVRMVEMCFEKGVSKVYLNTNGISLGKDPSPLDRLARYAENLQIYFQFDGKRPSTYQAIRGAKGLLDIKLQAIKNALERDIFVLPVMAVTHGINSDEVGDVVRFVLENHPRMNSLVLQPAFYAGRYLNEQHFRRVTVPDIVKLVREQTDGMFTEADFGPIPCSDPNCFNMAVGLVQDHKVIPISRYFPKYESWADADINKRIAQITNKLPQHMLDALADDEVVDQLLDLLAGEADDNKFTNWKSFMFIAIKPFMDANNYDQDRVDKCCTHIIDREGNPVSMCEYNTLRRPRGLL